MKISMSWVNESGGLSFIAETQIFAVNNVISGETGTMSDYDGNIYRTIKIGTQWWMAENLRVTRYRNGNAVPKITDNSAWTTLTSGAYCTYNSDETKAAIFGRLYNWYAVSDARGLAPAGWHVPSDAEWKTSGDGEQGASCRAWGRDLLFCCKVRRGCWI
jgi:hypothetical protein